MSKAIAESFVQLVWDTLKDPECADRSALLTAASAFLDAISIENGTLADAGRRVGHLAMDHAIFGGDTSELRYATGVLGMHGVLRSADKCIANLEQ